MTPCREWRGERTGKGYGRKYIKGGGRHPVFAHRWVVEQIDGPIPPGMIVMHVCDNPPCFRYDHLRVGTRAENNADRNTKGRAARGTSHGRNKLTEEQVRDIYGSTDAAAELASKHGVSKTMIRYIRTGRNWTHITAGEK